MKVKVKTLVDVRLDGKTEPAGKVVEINDWLLKDWLRLGLATQNIEEENPSKDTDPLPIGEKIKGKKAALKALKGGGADGTHKSRKS